MKIKDFKLEVFFGKHEFTAPYLLTQSDCESMSVRELLSYEPGAEEDFLDGHLGYTEVEGHPDLRKEISKLYTKIKSDEILVHVGAQEPIYNFMNVLLEEGDHVISQFPIYQSLYEVARALKCEVSNWMLHQGQNGWYMDFNELESMITDDTKLICINNPNNPTGFIFSDEELLKLVEICKRHDIYVISDEVYKGLEFDNVKRSSFADLYEKSVSVGVMSKAYGLAGLRLGWIATRNKILLENLIKFKHYTTICSSSTSEYLATLALRHSDKILDKNMALIRHNISIADAFFKRFPNLFENNKPMAGPVAFHKMNIDMPIKDFVENLIDEAGVLLLSADIYDYDGQYFRMGYGRADFEKNLGVFEAYLIKNNIS